MSTDLARKEAAAEERKKIKQRIELNQQLGFGLQGASAAQLNVIYILAQRYQLDPVTDLTLYRGVPWVKDQGWYRIIRRHPDFKTIDTRPLSGDEKQLWGFPVDDIVVECAIETVDHGTFKTRGRATRVEIDQAIARSQESGKAAAPIATWDVEMAEKRAIARCAKMAFGQDAPDSEDIAQIVAEEMARRGDPVTTAHNAQRYSEIYEGAYDLPEQRPALPAETPAAVAASEERGPIPAEARTEPPPQGTIADWERNRSLEAEAYAAGVRLPPLSNRATPDEVAFRNAELERLISERSSSASAL